MGKKGNKREQHMQQRQHNNRQMRQAVEAELFAILDTNGDGQLSQAEHGASNQREARQLAHKRAMFKHLDKDGSGDLSAAEMPNPGAHLAAADADGDGSVSKAEMRAHRQAQRSARQSSQ